MSTLSVITRNGLGTSYPLSDKVEYIHLGNDGFGLPDFERFMESGPLQDGATDLGYVLKPRKIQLVLNLLASTETDYWNKRKELLDIFRPTTEPLWLKLATPARNVYIPCYTEGGLSFSSTEKQAWKGHKVSLQLVAPDPVWYLDAVYTDVALLTGTQALPRNTTVAYTGNYKTHPQIFITGPITNCVITIGVPPIGSTNKLSFSGYTITNGDPITVDTRYGYKQVYLTNTPATSMLDKLTTDSDLSTFALHPTTDATNTVTVAGSGTSALTSIVMRYYTRFIGV